MTSTYVVFLLVGLSPIVASGQNLSSIVACPLFTPIPIMGNPPALEMLREWCAADPRCAEQYGQSISPNPTLFNMLFQDTTHSFTPPLYLQSPLIEKICPNMTWEEVNMMFWVVILRLDILERGRSCSEGQVPDILDEDDNIVCSDLPWTQCVNMNGFNVLGLAIEIAIFVLVLITIVIQMWSFIRRRKPQIV